MVESIMVHAQSSCVICTEAIKYYAIPETCGHNMVCWNCILKQRLKLDDEKCPMCKELSTRVLITDDPYDCLQQRFTSTTNNDNVNLKRPNKTDIGQRIEDTTNRIVFARQEIWTEIRKKIGNSCQLCGDSQGKAGQPSRTFPTLKNLRDHYVDYHKVDYCEFCLDCKPVLMFEQKLFKYKQLQEHIERDHFKCWFCPNVISYDLDRLNVHYRKDHYFCDICRKKNRRVRQVSRQTNNLPEFEVFKGLDELRNHCKKEHFLCNRPECLMLIFEEGVQLSEHSWKVHNVKMETKLEFGFQGDSDEEERQQKRLHAQQQRNFQREQFEEVKDFGERQRPLVVQKKEAVITKQDFPSLGGGAKKTQKDYVINFPTAQSILAEKQAEEDRQKQHKLIQKLIKQTPDASLKNVQKQNEKTRDLFEQQPILHSERDNKPQTSKGGKRKMVKMEVTASTDQFIEEESAIGREEAKQVVRDMMREKKQVQQNRPFTANKKIIKEDFPSLPGQKIAPIQKPINNQQKEAFPRFEEESKLESQVQNKPKKKPENQKAQLTLSQWSKIDFENKKVNPTRLDQIFNS